MIRYIRRLTIVAFFTVLTLGSAAEQARAQIAGPSARKPTGSIQPPGTTPQNQQPAQSQQPTQVPQTIPVGGASQTGVSQLLQNAAALALQQQPTTLDGLMQQQMQLALVSTVQQLQLAGQVQAVQLQQNALAAAARQKQTDDAAAQRKKRQTLSTEDVEEIFPKPEVKKMEQTNDDDASARQLRLAKKLNTDADMALFSGDRAGAAKLRAKVGERLSDIMEKYPKTPAAKEADSLLQSLYR
jgi:hypothetical protein